MTSRLSEGTSFAVDFPFYFYVVCSLVTPPTKLKSPPAHGVHPGEREVRSPRGLACQIALRVRSLASSWSFFMLDQNTTNIGLVMVCCCGRVAFRAVGGVEKGYEVDRTTCAERLEDAKDWDDVFWWP